MIRRKVASRIAARRLSSAEKEGDKMAEDRCEEDDLVTGEEEEEVPRKKIWKETSKEVYEEQLQQLQEQLEITMIDKLALQAELEERSQSAEGKELERLRQQNKELTNRLEDRAVRGSYGGSSITTSTSEEGYERVTMQPDRVVQQQRRRAQNRRSVDVVKDWVFDFLSDFTEDVRSSTDDTTETSNPLTAKRLKENVSRVATSTKPWRAFVTWAQDVLQWKNTSESLVVFLIYMYCVWHGWIIQLLLFIAITKLTLNYLLISGLADQFGISGEKRNPEDGAYDSMGLSDKLHLVKQVAQAVQNISGQLSDVLEKLRNLVLWHQPEATRKLYTLLWVCFIASLFVPNNYILTALGLGMGMKMFIIENVFRKYPKVKDKHDTVAHLWASLPTDAELIQRQSLTEEEIHTLPRRPSGDSTDDGNPVARLSEDESSFCQRFQLSPEELPLPSWAVGKRCTMIDRDKPLIGSKSGKLYLTHSFLCFEKSKARDCDRLIISLADIDTITKAKPFAVLPGSGMALEIIRRTQDKPVIFGAILHRDLVYQSIMDQGMILGMPWGADPDDIITNGEQNEANENQNTEDT